MSLSVTPGAQRSMTYSTLQIVFPILQNLPIKRKSQFRYFFWSEESQFADLIRLERQAANNVVNHAGSIGNQDVRIILLAIEAEQNIQLHVQVCLLFDLAYCRILNLFAAINVATEERPLTPSRIHVTPAKQNFSRVLDDDHRDELRLKKRDEAAGGTGRSQQVGNAFLYQRCRAERAIFELRGHEFRIVSSTTAARA